MNTFKKSSTVWIAVLTCSALVLGFLLLKQPAAEAAMVNAQPNYEMLTTGVPGGDEFLVIIDRQSERIAVYRQNDNQLVPIAHGPIDKIH